MGRHYQRGYLRCVKRKSGSNCWEFLWRENDGAGKRVRRTAVVGSVERYPTKQEALDAVNGLRMQVNADRNRQPVHPLLIADLIDHYIQTELSPSADWHSHATRIVYRYFMKKWIQPHWGKMGLAAVRTIDVQHWLRGYNGPTALRWPNQRKPRFATFSACCSIMQSAMSGSNRAEIRSPSFVKARCVRVLRRCWTPTRSRAFCCSWIHASA